MLVSILTSIGQEDEMTNMWISFIGFTIDDVLVTEESIGFPDKYRVHQRNPDRIYEDSSKGKV